MLLSTEYAFGDKTYLAGEVIKGNPDKNFNKELDWLHDEIVEIAYVTATTSI